jgi:anti-sigma-K factor RskA
MSDSSEDIYLRAGEYVLGLLDAEEMAQVRRDAAGDPLLVDAIGFWERRLAPLAAFIPAVAPPGWLWERIEAQLGAPAAAAPAPAAPPADNVVPFKPRSSLPWWRATAIASMAVAAALAVALFRPQPPAPAPVAPPPDRFAGILPLKDDLKGHAWLADIHPDGKIRVTALGSIIQPTQRDLWLWVVPKGTGAAPIAVGALPGSGSFSLPAGVKPEALAALAVSDEKAGITPKTPDQIDYLGAVVVPN